MTASEPDRDLLYRARYLAATIAEDRHEVDRHWRRALEAQEEAAQRSQLRATQRLILLVLVGLCVGVLLLLIFAPSSARGGVFDGSLSLVTLTITLANLAVAVFGYRSTSDSHDQIQNDDEPHPSG